MNQCCDRVAILHRGKLRYDGPVHALADELAFVVRIAETVTEDAWSSIASIESAQLSAGHWQIKLATGTSAARLADAIVKKGWSLLEMRPHEANLESIFLRIASADETQEAA